MQNIRSGSGCTFIIHDEVGNGSIFIQADDLTILSSDINNGTDFRVQEMCPSCMTGNLRNTLITI